MLNLRSTGTAWLLRVCLDLVLLDQLGTSGLDKHIKFKLQLMSKSVRSVATKVAMNGIIFGPFHLLVFFTYMGLCAGKCVPVKCFLDSAFLSCLEQQKGAPLKKWFASFHSTITNEKGGGH
ncbi:hypothetical protein GmHk_08G021279 [Glycine max]|nr:hypothetical protein GmHk_08G021279 [Glycine max]